MARRQQRRRPAFRGPRGGDRRDQGAAQAALDANAQRLLATWSGSALESYVTNLRALRDEADRVAREEPSPDALRAYRRAARELAEAERALVLDRRP